MRTLSIEIAAGVATAVLTYVVFTASEDTEAWLRWLLVGLLGLVAICAGGLAARTAARRPWANTEVAAGVKAKGDVTVSDVQVAQPSSSGTRVGTDIRSGGDVRVKGVRVDEKGDEDSGRDTR